MERDAERGEESGSRPSDTEELVGDTPTSEPLTSAPRVQPSERASRDGGGGSGGAGAERGVPTGEDAEREAELGHS